MKLKARSASEKRAVKSSGEYQNLLIDPSAVIFILGALVLWPGAIDPSIPKGLLAPCLLLQAGFFTLWFCFRRRECGIAVTNSADSEYENPKFARFSAAALICLCLWMIFRLLMSSYGWHGSGLSNELIMRFMTNDSMIAMVFVLPFIRPVSAVSVVGLIELISWILTPLWLAQLISPDILGIAIVGSRVTASLGNPNILGVFAALSLVFSLGRFRLERKTRFLLKIFMDIVLLILVRSMAAAIAAAIGIASIFLIGDRKGTKGFIPAFLLAGVTVLAGNILLIMPWKSMDSGTSTFLPVLGYFGKSTNIQERRFIAMASMNASMNASMSNQFTGLGCGRAVTLIQNGLDSRYHKLRPGEVTRIPHHCHGEYLELFLEEGAAGLLFFMGIAFCLISGARELKGSVSELSKGQGFQLTLLSGILVILVDIGFSVSGRNPFVRTLLFYLCGCFAAEAGQCASDSSKSQNGSMNRKMSILWNCGVRKRLGTAVIAMMISATGLVGIFIQYQALKSSNFHFRAREILSGRQYGPGDGFSSLIGIQEAEKLLASCDPLCRGGLLALKDMAGLQMVRGKYEEAFKYLTLLEQTAPGFGDTRTLLGAASLSLGKSDEATGHFLNHFRNHGNDDTAAFNVSISMERSGNKDASLYAALAWQLLGNPDNTENFQRILKAFTPFTEMDDFINSAGYREFLQNLNN
ncbi:MAG: hypothetical protein CVV64_02615 [Candidatus Wallbacteria bacterium HGW-Wallbacteria-1]|jgi:hypothetical protein|uniref:O-antigen ligase domain-containing protein n=1 Tax=Candidatus Wallbacteria bacterium HGW-Wallbacteria-1 TaxID=2013854 RepID=A0A2N1PVF7_9BACT|nr:MAG: hypothetical protein CVV64_02615 [Candidatus Wallbacteria bacterium HGW-Wallbacteria-1]